MAHLICVPQVPQMWHKMWHNSIYILSTNVTICDVFASNDPNVPQSVAHLICVPQVPQMWHKMWHKMWHNSIYILSTNVTIRDVFGQDLIDVTDIYTGIL